MSGSDPVWPLPCFNFAVAVDGVAAGTVTEVIGLGMRIEDGTVRPCNVAFKRGVYAGDLSWWNWFADAADGQAARTITIDLLDETRTVVRRWTLEGARPFRIAGPALRADSNEAAIEEIELACDHMVVTIPDDDQSSE